MSCRLISSSKDCKERKQREGWIRRQHECEVFNDCGCTYVRTYAAAAVVLMTWHLGQCFFDGCRNCKQFPLRHHLEYIISVLKINELDDGESLLIKGHLSDGYKYHITFPSGLKTIKTLQRKFYVMLIFKNSIRLLKFFNQSECLKIASPKN